MRTEASRLGAVYNRIHSWSQVVGLPSVDARSGKFKLKRSTRSVPGKRNFVVLCVLGGSGNQYGCVFNTPEYSDSSASIISRNVYAISGSRARPCHSGILASAFTAKQQRHRPHPRCRSQLPVEAVDRNVRGVRRSRFLGASFRFAIPFGASPRATLTRQRNARPRRFAPCSRVDERKTTRARFSRRPFLWRTAIVHTRFRRSRARRRFAAFLLPAASS